MAENLEVLKKQPGLINAEAAKNKRDDLSVVEPETTWPPPLYLRSDASQEEVNYMLNRWHTQWSYYDERALAAKRNYQRLQLIITVGSAAVPVLVGVQTIEGTIRVGLSVATIIISFMVAAASAIETVMKYGDAWRSYRAATEELMREKALYDVQSGSYRRSKKPFLLFVERCEDIMNKQNGNWSSLKEEQVQQLEQQTNAALDGDLTDDK